MTAVPLIPVSVELRDEDIVRRIVEGERELFELLLRRYNQRIYRAVRAVLRNPEDTEDVMQQAYVNAYRHLHQFEGRSSFPTWMTKIAIREAFARNRKTELHGENKMSDFREPSADPEERAVAADLLQHVEAEVAALPEAYRAVLILREVEGLSTEETAECLQLSTDVVKTRLHRARTMLRDAMDRRTGMGLRNAFTFGSQHCDRVVTNVMERIRAL
jgi:RNA polymerase sigma-70 factor, ECF subfamily